MQRRRRTKAIHFFLPAIAMLFVALFSLPARADEQPQRVRIRRKEMAQRLKTKVARVYPDEAKRNKIEGTVKLSVLIATDGTIKQLQVISGHPLLVRSALDTVRQWTYEPVTVHERAVEVVTEVDVNYQLGK